MASFLYRWSLTDGKGVVLEFSLVIFTELKWLQSTIGIMECFS